MKPNDIDKAIALIRGWTDLRDHSRVSWCPLTHGKIPKDKHEVWTSTPHLIPQFHKDLNAMHDAERMLSPEQWDDYCDLLGGALRECANATALKKAEAFLRVFGKWEGK
jgi:hypothetical protein